MKPLTTVQDTELEKYEEHFPESRWALLSLALSMLLSSLGVSIANIALPTLTQVFSVTHQQVQWIIIIYLLSTTITAVSVGHLGDLLGHRTVLISGITIFTIASIFCGMAPFFGMLIFGRALQGAGAAVLMVFAVATIREITPTHKTGSAMGVIGTMSAVGTVLGPALGGILIAEAGWTSIFFILGSFGALNLFLSLLYLPKARPAFNNARKTFDSSGSLILCLTLVAFLLAMTLGNGHFSQLNLALLVTSVLGAGLFILIENKVETPLIQLNVFKNSTFTAGLMMNTIVATVMMTTLVVGPFYLSLSLGFNTTSVGLIMTVGPVISMLSGIPAGVIVDRMSPAFIVVSGLVAMATGAFALSILPLEFGVSGYLLAIAILTPGYQLFQAANNTSVMTTIPQDIRGVASGMLGLSRNLGLMTGASLMSAIFFFKATQGNINTSIAENFANGMQSTFIVAGFCIIFALGLAIRNYARKTR